MENVTIEVPAKLHAVAGYIVRQYEGNETELLKSGDTCIDETLGWEYWADNLPEGYGRNRTLSKYTVWAADADTLSDFGERVGAVLMEITVPEDVRTRIGAAQDEETAGLLLNEWVDDLEWRSGWESPHVTILKETKAFRETRSEFTLDLSPKTTNAREQIMENALDVWIKFYDPATDEDDGDFLAAYGANTYREGEGYRIEWYHNDVGQVTREHFDTLAEAHAWYERNGFQDINS